MRSTAHSPPRGRPRHPSRRPQFEEVETSDSLAFSPSLSRGTEGSNPAPSSGESSANLIIGAGLLSLGGDNAALGERADELVAITTEHGFPAAMIPGSLAIAARANFAQ